jgi:hypothetical protein
VRKTASEKTPLKKTEQADLLRFAAEVHSVLIYYGSLPVSLALTGRDTAITVSVGAQRRN